MERFKSMLRVATVTSVVSLLSFMMHTNDTNDKDAAAASKSLFPAVIVLGDSTVDVGTNNHLVTPAKANFPPYGRDFPDGKATGRFCNGLLTIDYLVSWLGFSSFPLPYLDPEAKGEKIVTGVNFASAASGFLNSTGRIYNVLPFAKQIKQYKEYRLRLEEVIGPDKAASILSGAFYLISTGSNDYLNYFQNPVLREKYTPDGFASFLLNVVSNFIEELYDLGARKIAILSLPPIGCLPAQIFLHKEHGKSCVETYNKAAVDFNEGMQNMVEAMNKELEGGMLLCLDSYHILMDAITNATKYGFSYVHKGCCGTGSFEASILCNELSLGTCQNASMYVFWDTYHPTQRMNKIIVESLIEQAQGYLM